MSVFLFANMSRPYYEYEDCPRILDLDNQKDLIKELRDGKILFCPNPEDQLPFKEIVLNKNQIFDLVPTAVNGLLEDLAPGTSLMDEFMKIWEGPPHKWVFYPDKSHLVKFIESFWHRSALLVRNSTLLRDPQMKLSWKEIRNIFESSVIAVAGGSVGGIIAQTVVRNIRPKHIKIADPKAYRLNNANRTPLTYEDFGKNKAIVTAKNIHRLDPYIKISVFEEGIDEDNIYDFIIGNQELNEPKSTIIIEEIDDLDLKLRIREIARKHKIPIIMATDLGSAPHIDVRRYDVDDKLSLAYDISDEKLYKIVSDWKKDLANREKFHEFVFAMIGNYFKDNLPEVKDVMFKETPPLFGGVPQLGSTVAAASGIIAEYVSRILLGFKVPERMIIDFYNKRFLTFGRQL